MKSVAAKESAEISSVMNCNFHSSKLFVLDQACEDLSIFSFISMRAVALRSDVACDCLEISTAFDIGVYQAAQMLYNEVVVDTRTHLPKSIEHGAGERSTELVVTHLA